jgi:hypothetical protein
MLAFLLSTCKLLTYQLHGQKKTPSVIRPGQRLPDLFQQPDEFLQLALGEMAHELMVQGDQRLIEAARVVMPWSVSAT